MKSFAEKYTNDSEQKILLRRIGDMLSRSEKTYSAVYSGFLTRAEQTLISSVEELKGYISFDGGYENAERRICRVGYEEYCADDGLPVKIYSAEASGGELSHRNVLGSLMGLGIKRNMIGDIVTEGNTAYFFCCNAVSDFIEFNLKRIGKYYVSVSREEHFIQSAVKTRLITASVASMRFDCVCAECFGLSRIRAADCIERGEASLNWLVCTDKSVRVSAGDKISVRKKGKAEVSNICGTSKKGRIFLEIKKYI